MKINSYLRLAFMFGNNQTQTFQSNLNKMIRLVLHGLKMGDSLTVIDIIDQLQEQYGLAFSDNEVIEAIKNKQSKIICTNEGQVNDEAKKKYSISPEEYERISSKVNDDGGINNVISRFLLFDSECEYSEDELRQLLFRHLYSVFNSNAESILDLIDNKHTKFQNDSEDFLTEEKETINRFLCWEDTEKDKYIYQMISCCFDYCMMTVKKNNSAYSDVLRKKSFYFDTNVVFRLMGLNQEGRKKILDAFVTKCRDAKIELRFTNFTKQEVDNTIKHYVNQISRLISQQDPISTKSITAFSPYAVNSDFYSAYVEWCNQPFNKIGDYSAFESDLKQKAEKVLSEFKMDSFEDYSVNKKQEFDIKQNALTEYKLEKNRSIRAETIKIDVNNYMYVLDLNTREKSSDFYNTRNFIISADHAYGDWAKSMRPGTIPMIVLPSVWYSIILQYCSRTDDDQKSFTRFLKFSMSSSSDEPDERKKQILKYILDKVNEPAEIKDKILFSVSEKLKNDHEDMDTVEEIVEQTHKFIVDAEAERIRSEEQEKANKRIESIKDDYESKTNENESTHKIEINTVKQELLDSKEERRIENGKNEERLAQAREQEKENCAIALANQNLPKTYKLYWILAICIFVVAIVLLALFALWLSKQPVVLFSNGSGLALELLITLIPLALEAVLGWLIIRFALCDLNKENIKKRLIDRYTVK